MTVFSKNLGDWQQFHAQKWVDPEIIKINVFSKILKNSQHFHAQNWGQSLTMPSSLTKKNRAKYCSIMIYDTQRLRFCLQCFDQSMNGKETWYY